MDHRTADTPIEIDDMATLRDRLLGLSRIIAAHAVLSNHTPHFPDETVEQAKDAVVNCLKSGG